MANLINKSLLTTQLPTLCFRRFRGKINIQRPRQPHYERQIVIDISKPFYAKKEKIRPCPTYTRKVDQNENPYERIIAKEAKNWIENSQMVGIFHANPISSDDFFKARVIFHQQGIQLKKYGRSILANALEGTNYEVLCKLNESNCFSTVYAFCPEHKRVGKMLSILKKIPQFHLLCGVVDGQLLSKNEFTGYATNPGIDVARSQLVNVLNMAGSSIVQNLESHQSQLVRILDAHVRENGGNQKSSDEKCEEIQTSEK